MSETVTRFGFDELRIHIACAKCGTAIEAALSDLDKIDACPCCPEEVKLLAGDQGSNPLRELREAIESFKHRKGMTIGFVVRKPPAI